MINIGVIGCGGIFRHQHAPYYEVSKRARIAAVADIKEDVAQQQAERFDADAYTDWKQILDRTDIDAVDICAHPRPHRDIAVAAAQAGKHILVEKPMCRNIAEADEMNKAADEANVNLQVAYIMRFDPNYMKLKELLDNGILGEPHMAYCNQVGWFNPSHHPWLFIKEESGGMLVEQAIHNLDAWLWLYGNVSSSASPTLFLRIKTPRPRTKTTIPRKLRTTILPMIISSKVLKTSSGVQRISLRLVSPTRPSLSMKRTSPIFYQVVPIQL